MRALFLSESGPEFRIDCHEPDETSGESIVKVDLAGVCETDLQLIRGYMNFSGILGHEFVGTAETGPLAGQRVCGELNCSCGDCDLCGRGMANHCPHRTVIGILGRNGAFAERLSVPNANLHRIPDEVEDERAVFVEPLAAAFRILEQLRLDGNERVVVLGSGRLGNLCAQVLNSIGCHVTAVDKHSEKLQLLSELDRGISVAMLDDLPHAGHSENKADIVVDCTGSPTGLPTALRLVRPRGTIVLKTTVAAETQMPHASIVIDEISIIGSRCGPFAPAIEALAQGSIDVRSLISARYQLDDGVEAIEAAGQNALKVLIDPKPG
ncbi:MDR/zinc-dependent alcohol dehydrogenase-like family protein [Stratiformator vulcanicus]|uniref:2-deoxy-scyllo-inosamine dehydrogenase n=1 Tax=Stratiformator vulcanicus TaxID=2527980 RepID=A0A517QYZ1_9PLAN|nr:alcohol dehydrogenase catalytic domain-containing protein [Stratiformator vulcanicus]QDT36852.1 2-deoxy-scyllo-inosamine dehydrogenase [Stratiformator vulcanicus]